MTIQRASTLPDTCFGFSDGLVCFTKLLQGRHYHHVTPWIVVGALNIKSHVLFSAWFSFETPS